MKHGTASLTASVIIPTRNCLSYLPAAIASVEAQQMLGVEIIVVDDGSSDGTGEWLRRQSQRTPGLRVLQGRGDGPNVARNRGIAIAQAPLVAFLDADDVWLPGKLLEQVAFHEADPALVFSFADFLHVDSHGRSSGTIFSYWPAFRGLVRRLGPGEAFRRLERPDMWILAENVVGTSTVVARRDALRAANGFNAALRSAADWDLWLRLAAIGPVGFGVTLGAKYLMHRADSVSSDARLRIACMRQIVAMHAPRAVLAPGGATALRRARAHVLMTEAELARAEMRYGAAFRAGLAALWRAPSRRLVRGFVGDLLSAARLRPCASLRCGQN